MSDQQFSDQNMPDMAEFSRNMSEVAARSQQLVSQFLARQAEESQLQSLDPLNIGNAFLELTAKMMADPAKLAEAQFALWNDYIELWQSAAQRMMGQSPERAAKPDSGDRRFRDPEWDENQVFDYIKQSYLLTARWIQATVQDVDGLDEETSQKVAFYTRQFVDAMAPTNFMLTNPEVLRATLESNGQNLVKGLGNMLEDLERGKGKLHIKMTDTEAFEIGVNVATTPGKVVFQNDLLQLIQYTPTTDKVYKVSLLIAPPWINKFYILDLRESNSFIKWAVSKGHTVFVISWVNPGEDLADTRFEDYMTKGLLAAADAVTKATGEEQMNVIGYCIGGTLLAPTLAYLAAKEDERFKTATFFAAQADFSEAGELSVFIDEEQLANIETMMEQKGFLDAGEMSTTFNMLRANDLIWSFVIHNYLLGKEPFPFDLLYWNGDSTRMPAKMHSFYLRKMYQHNLLAQPGGITLDGVPIDLGKVKIPIYVQSGKDDHIAPVQSVFKMTQLFKGPVKFICAGSGHIAGVINPPGSGKYGYWTNSKKAASVEEWFSGTKAHEDSWWPDWHKWLSRKSGPKVAARHPGDGKLKAIEDAPGSYVKVT